MHRRRVTQLRKDYESKMDHYDALGRIVVSSLRSLLIQANIPFLSVSYRVKHAESFIAKVKRKKYKHPECDCTDILGVRVITYIEGDVDKTSNILKSSFDIDVSRSLDKSALLKVDQIGYRSVHFVASLGAARCALPEFTAFAVSVFEVQIRTVLQHAWAEIEHDRNYKLPTSLPLPLERRLYLLAGALELADREFNNLAADIDAYGQSVAVQTNAGDWNVELNTPSLKVFCETIAKRFKRTKVDALSGNLSYDALVPELKDYGIQNLQMLESLFSENYFQAYDREDAITNAYGMLRDAMMLANLPKYFDQAWNGRWSGIEPDDLRPLLEKYGPVARALVDQGKLTIDTPSDSMESGENEEEESGES